MSLKPAQAQAESDGRAIVSALVERSNRLGADPRNTNYAGGNTSAKGWAIDPVTGEPVELLWVKGSGGDLGTLTERGLAVLRLDRVRSLVEVYPGVEREDEMVGAFDYCLFGRGGAAPSIDTAMHGLIDADHVDHLHPDSGIAFATAADGPELTRRCFGDRVAWVDWRRPGFELALDLAGIRRARPEAIGAILGGHGITAWGATSAECEERSLEIIRTAETFIAEHGRADPFGRVVAGYDPLTETERRARAAELFPLIRGLVSTDRPQVGHYDDSVTVLDFLRPGRAPAAGRAGHVVPGPLPADQGPADGPRPAAVRGARDGPGAAPRAPRGLSRRVPPLLRAVRDRRQPADARRRPGDRPRARDRDVLVRCRRADRAGRRRVLRQRDQRDARRRGALDLRADPGGREVPDRVLGARGGEARPPAEAEATRDEGRRRHRGRVGDRQGDRPSAGGRGRLRRGRRHRRAHPRRPSPRSSAGRTSRSASSPT